MSADVNIHFAFPDGMLAYDCEHCHQPCCKTGYLTIFPRERTRLMQLVAATELVAPSNSETVSLFATPPSACWFLTNQRCTLVSANGGVARPVACTLFPFNVFAIHGQTLVIAPNSLCPMTVRLNEGIELGSVSSLLEQLGAAGVPPTTIRLVDPPEALALEILLRDAAASVVTKSGPMHLLALSEQATDAFAEGGIEALSMLDLRAIDSGVVTTRERLRHDAALLGIDFPGADGWQQATPLLAAWLPSIRLLSFEATPIDRLARATSVLALLLARWCSLRPRRQPLPQTLTELAATMGPLCHLIARWDDLWTGRAIDELALIPGEPLNRVESRLSPEPLARRRQLWAIIAAERRGGRA